MNRILKGTLMLGAPRTWSASFMPMICGYTCAFLMGNAAFSLESAGWILLSFIAMALIETGKHAVNDLVDFVTGNDTAVDEEHKTPFSGGKKVLTEGILSKEEVIWVAAVTLTLAGAAGLAIAYFQSMPVLLVGAAGMAVSVLYTLPPVKLCYRGCGELAVGITYGPLIFLGAYMVFSCENIMIPLLLSLHTGCLITNVLVINEYPDYEADLAAEKMNLIARVGKEKGTRWYLGLFLMSYLPVFAVVFYTGSRVFLITLILIPWMWKAYKNCIISYNDIGRLIWSNAQTINIHICSSLLLVISMILI